MGYIPTASLGYNISEESFFEPLKGILNYLKLKASYGISGNAEIGTYANESRYSQANYNGLNGITLSNIADDELGWETSTQTNFGVSMELMNGKFRADIDYYDKLTKDLLLPYPVSIVSGLTQVTTNLGEISNKGIEVVLGATLADTEELTWDVELTYAHNKNEVLDIGDNPEGINLLDLVLHLFTWGCPLELLEYPFGVALILQQERTHTSTKKVVLHILNLKQQPRQEVSIIF